MSRVRMRDQVSRSELGSTSTEEPAINVETHDSYVRSKGLRKLAAGLRQLLLGPVQRRSATNFSQSVGQLARTEPPRHEPPPQPEVSAIALAIEAASTLRECEACSDRIWEAPPELRQKLDAKFQGIAADRQARIREGTYTRAMLAEDYGIAGEPFLWRVFGIHGVEKKTPPEGAGIGRMDNSHTEWILTMLERHAPAAGDVFYDIGAGVGFVTKLMSVLTKATIKGVEIDDDYDRIAQTTASDLRLNVEHVHAEATTVDYSDGKWFYLFNPFPYWRGKENSERFLKGTLEGIRRAAEVREIVVMTTCMPDLEQPWLELIERNNGLSIYRSNLKRTV